MTFVIWLFCVSVTFLAYRQNISIFLHRLQLRIYENVVFAVLQLDKSNGGQQQPLIITFDRIYVNHNKCYS